MFMFYLRDFDVTRLNVQHGRTGSVFTQIQQHQILGIMSTQKSDYFSDLNLISYLKRVKYVSNFSRVIIYNNKVI